MGYRWRHGHRTTRQGSSRWNPLSTTGRLSDWGPGTDGIITDVQGSNLLAARLRELGVIPGHRVRVLRGGQPLIIQVGGSRIGMRRQDAASVHVRPLPSDSSPSQSTVAGSRPPRRGTG